MDPYVSGSVEEQLRELRAQVGRLQEALERSGILGHEATPTAPPPKAKGVESPHEPAAFVRQMPVDVALPEPAPAGARVRPGSSVPPSLAAYSAVHERSLESRIGSQWFNRIGILAMLIGMAWFLKLAVDNSWVGPLGRVLIGLGAGAGLIAWSERFNRKGYAVFSYSLKAVGSGILYLSLWAAFSVYHLIPSGVAFAAMIAVTAFNGFMAWVQDAELLALYAIVGGLTTPLLLSTGGNHEVTLFSYLALLDLAVLILVMLRPWSRLLFMAFVGTVAFYVGWSISFSGDYQSTTTTLFTVFFFLAFALAPRLIRVRGSQTVPPSAGNSAFTNAVPTSSELSPWDNLAALVLPILNAALGFAAVYLLFDSPGATWAGAIEAVAFAAFYLVLLRLPAKGILRSNPKALTNLHLATAVVFLSVAIPLKTHGRWLTIGWLTEGSVLLWTSTRVRSRLLGVLGIICLLLGLVTLVLINPVASTTPILNERFAAYVLAIAIFALVAWLALQQASISRLASDSAPEAASAATPVSADFFNWQALAAIAVLLVNALTLLALSYEIHNYWWQLHWRSVWTYDVDRYRAYSMDAQFTYSALFMMYGGALLAIGFLKSSAFLRWQALALIAVAIGKVFLIDMSHFSQGYRVVSFLALGVLLLAVSFVYQRDWLKLRGPLLHDAVKSDAGKEESPLP